MADATGPEEAGASLRFTPSPFGPPDILGARSGASVPQKLGFLLAAAAFLTAFAGARAELLAALRWGFFALFALGAGWRAFLITRSPRPWYAPVVRRPSGLPKYTVVAALYREAGVAAQLIGALERIDYPADRIEVLFAVEEDDPETAAALLAASPPPHMRILTVPQGAPKTKPRALNHALHAASGEFLVVYDAEDAPDPLQLREAVRRFETDAEDLVCLQAPLRIRSAERGFLRRQFAAEYAALFEVALPALARLGLPLPLGGTSNHFRVEALRALGGWDAWNVTEDADLGFRIARFGWRTGVLTRATSESPPQDLRQWLPQRTRWLKGYLQTWLVHTRRPRGLDLRAGLTLHATLGLTLLAAGAHGVVLCWIVAVLLLSAAAGVTPPLPWPDMILLVAGWAVALASVRLGQRRARRRFDLGDALAAPFYWALLTLAAVFALWQFVVRRHHWDKTDHAPDGAFPLEDEAAGRLAA